MKTGKSIYDAFRESEQKLATPPPPRAWEKLDKKLSVSRRRTRVIHSKHLIWIITVLMLAIALFYIVDHQQRRNGKKPGQDAVPVLDSLKMN